MAILIAENKAAANVCMNVLLQTLAWTLLYLFYISI
jgi:hypothetical protein